jgi:hypothetical protein
MHLAPSRLAGRAPRKFSHRRSGARSYGVRVKGQSKQAQGFQFRSLCTCCLNDSKPSTNFVLAQSRTFAITSESRPTLINVLQASWRFFVAKMCTWLVMNTQP